MKSKTLSSIIVIIALLALIASCQRFSQIDSSKLDAEYNGQKYDSFIEISDDGQIDESAEIVFTATHCIGDSVVKGALFDFECDAEGVEMREYGTSGRQCCVRLSDLMWLGTYRITAKSRVDAKWDRTFTVSIVTSASSMTVSYELTNEDTADSGRITGGMRYGTVSGTANKLELAAGGIYRITANVTPASGSVRNILCSSSDTSVAYFTNVSGNTATLAIPGGDGKRADIRIALGRTNVAVGAQIVLTEVSDADVVDYTDGNAGERVLSFTANTAENPDLTYEYILSIKGLNPDKEVLISMDAEVALADSDSPEGARHEYRNGDRLALGSLAIEQWLSDSPYRKLSPNTAEDGSDAAHWYRIMTLSGSLPDDAADVMPAQGWPDRERFQVSYNSVTRRIRIKPLADTVWNRRGVNSHHYIYFKYADDTQWRWRFRVMVGGVTEGLRLMSKSKSTESWDVPEGKEITIHDGDQLLYYMRAEFLPTVPSANQHLLFYLSDRTEPDTFYSHDVTKTFVAPKPSASAETNLNADSEFWAGLGGEEPVIGNEDDRINELIKDALIRSDFQPDARFCLPAKRNAPWNGIADERTDAWAAYCNVEEGWIEFTLRIRGNGRSFTLVAIDPVTKMYDYIRITEAPGRAGTQKSIKGDPFCAVENNRYFTDEAGGAASFDVYTSYEMDESGENPKIKNTTKGKCWSVWNSDLRRERLKNGRQEYPMNKYDIAMYREDLKGERITASSDYVFYMDRDDPLVLEWNYNFPVYDMTVTPLNANAISYGGQTDVTINYVQTKENSTGEKQQFGYDGFLKFNSLWNTMNSDDQKKTAHIQYKSIMIDNRTGEYNGDLLWKVTITTDSDDGGADTVTLKIRTIVVAEREKVKRYEDGRPETI